MAPAREGNRRKAVIVLSDGVDTDFRDVDRDKLANVSDGDVPTAIDPNANQNLTRILNKADLLGATVYPLALPTGDPSKLADPTPRQVAMYKAARARLQTVADRTGGTLHAINRLEDMGNIYAIAAAEIRTLARDAANAGRRIEKMRFRPFSGEIFSRLGIRPPLESSRPNCR